MRKIFSCVLPLVLFASCARLDPPPAGQPPLESANVIYLHHSTGEVIWGGGVPGLLDGTGYTISEEYFPNTTGGYPWNNYPYDYWNIWINHEGPLAYMNEPTLEMLTKTYNVIVFKHCFPVSDIEADSGAVNVASPSQQLQNYYLQYNALKEKMHDFPDTRFIVWTGAALRESETNPDSADRARTFFTWVRDTWDKPGDNIYVWDFWTLETDGGLYLTPEHAAGDSHPSAAFAAEVAPYFVNRLVDVIEGRGDTGSITGK